MSDEQTTYKVNEVAEILRIGKNAAYSLVHQDGFPQIRIGKTIRIPREAFHIWLNSRCKK